MADTNSTEEAPSKWDIKHLVAYGGLITAIASLIGSFNAWKKASTEQVAKDSYKTTILAIERLSDESALNHADIVSLRTYLVDHVSSSGSSQVVMSSEVPPPPPIPVRAAPIVITKTRGSAPKPSTTITFSTVGSAIANKKDNPPSISMPDSIE